MLVYKSGRESGSPLVMREEEPGRTLGRWSGRRPGEVRQHGRREVGLGIAGPGPGIASTRICEARVRLWMTAQKYKWPQSMAEGKDEKLRRSCPWIEGTERETRDECSERAVGHREHV